MTEGDGKQEAAKAGDKARPTAEQMRIAQIIDTRSEDPALKEKIRQVMDATRKGEDEVCAALFDCDNDPDRAVDLLLEGVQSEWSTSKKKKKRGERGREPGGGPRARQEEPDWDEAAEEAAAAVVAVAAAPPGAPEAAGRRGARRGQGDDRDTGGRRGRGRGRGRGPPRPRPPFRRPPDAWDPAAPGPADPVEDWDNEVYTGSLADSKVFTSSSVGGPAPGPEPPADGDPGPPPAPRYLPRFASDGQTDKVGNAQNSSVFHESRYTGDPFASAFGVNSYDSSETDSNVLPCEDVRLRRVPPLTKIRARIPPPSKIPSSAVEMPPDAVGGGMALLDVQFGALDFGEASEGAQQPPVSTPPGTSPSPTTPDKLTNAAPMSVTELIGGDSSFSPVRSAGSSSVTPQMNDLSSAKPGESVQSAFCQETVYPSSGQFSKSSHTQASSFANSFTSTQSSSSSSGYNAVSSANNYSATNAASYTNSAYPQYQSYSGYPSQSQALTAAPNLHLTNSYQSGTANQYGGTQNSVYSTTSSYSTPYQSYSVNPQHNPKTPLSSVSSGNKDFETPSNLNSISQSTTISAPSLSTSTQTTCASKPSAMNTSNKGTVVAGMPPGVPPIVGAQYIMSQGGMPYFQQPLYGYEELQLLPQQRLPPHLPGGYYEVGYQAPTTREGVQYNISDARLARADNNTSPVQVTSINQQSGTQGHQQPLMNPSAIPPAYAYFYGGSVIPGNFQYGAPTFYPTGTGSGHSSSSGLYGKGLAAYTGGYGSYEGGQGTAGDYKGPNQIPKTQSAQTNPAGSSDIYTKTHAALSKSYEKSGFHSGTPPPFTLSSQNSGMGPTGGYAPQHLFIPPMTQHNTPMMHHPLQQEPGARGAQPSKVGAKTANYSPSAYWTQN